MCGHAAKLTEIMHGQGETRRVKVLPGHNSVAADEGKELFITAAGNSNHFAKTTVFPRNQPFQPRLRINPRNRKNCATMIINFRNSSQRLINGTSLQARASASDQKTPLAFWRRQSTASKVEVVTQAPNVIEECALGSCGGPPVQSTNSSPTLIMSGTKFCKNSRVSRSCCSSTGLG